MNFFPPPENDDLFMMPRIVNVTSLATEGGLVDMGGSKYPHEVPDGKPPDHLKSTVRNEDNSFEDSGESLPEAAIEMAEWHWVQHQFFWQIKILVFHK